MEDPISPLYQLIRSAPIPADRPFITLTYAQSLDGSIAVTPNQQLELSAPESLRMTHQLRSLHDGIMVGVGTVLADDPQLTVREVTGSNPQPIILDTRLRTPLQSRLLQSGATPLIFHGPDIQQQKASALQRAGVELSASPLDADGRLAGPHIMAELRGRGVERLMVEGGARVIDYLLQSGTADLLVLTIAPQLVGGLRPMGADVSGDLPQLQQIQWQRLGDDMILWGHLAQASA